MKSQILGLFRTSGSPDC